MDDVDRSVSWNRCDEGSPEQKSNRNWEIVAKREPCVLV